LTRFQEADDVYQKSIDIDPHSRIADAALSERRKIASRQSKNE